MKFVLAIAFLVLSLSTAEAARTCTTTCYGNSCTTQCYGW